MDIEKLATEYQQVQAIISGDSVTDGSIYDAVPFNKHLLIAGATGSGKSVLLNGLIYKALESTPLEKWFILIDPKRVELHQYTTRHTLFHADTMPDIIHALKCAVAIMNRRYTEMKKQGVKQYDGATVYIIIDELADIILTSKKQVEPLLNELLILGRAAGVFCWVCTQRCTIKVVSEFVKSQCDTRIALKVANKQESRNILDGPGAEQLSIGECLLKYGTSINKYSVPMVEDDAIIDRVNKWNEADPVKKDKWRVFVRR